MGYRASAAKSCVIRATMGLVAQGGGNTFIDLRISIEPATISGLQALLAQVQAIVAAPFSTKAQLDRIEAAVGAIGAKMHTLDDILAETQRQTTIEDSMEALLKGLKDQVDAAGGNQAKIDAAFAAFSANNDRAAAAVVANTAAQPVPTPAP